MKFLNLLLFVVVSSFYCQYIEAKAWSNQYIEFELPNGWECALEGSEWVCQSDNKERKKEAIIILAAKYRGENDTIEQYQSYLKAPKTFNLPGGKTQISEPKLVQLTDINGQKWVDSLHLASEVPGFYTRYLATVKDNLGVAVTFSVGKDHYDAYRDIFDKIIASLKVFDQKQNTGDFQAVNKQTEGDLTDSTIGIGDTTALQDLSKQNAQKKGDGGMDDTTMMLGGLIAVAVVFFILKNKKKGKKKK